MALWLAGVEPDAIAADHALSDESWAPYNEEWLAAAPDEHERERRRRISQPAGRTLVEVLEEIEERDGHPGVSCSAREPTRPRSTGSSRGCAPRSAERPPGFPASPFSVRADVLERSLRHPCSGGSAMRVIWLSVATAISGLALVGALGASEAARPERANAGVSAYATTAYGWPLKPFHSPHPVRGNFGDPRTVLDGPPTTATLYHGNGSFSFHRGVDIYGSRGAKVYPVRSGIVVFLSASHVNIKASDGTTFEYWHIGSHRLPGTIVHAYKTVLGTIGSAGHVDLTEVQNGHAVNPLASGHLTPYTDRTHPVVASIRLQSDNAGSVLFPNYHRQRLARRRSFVAVGNWHGLPVTPALEVAKLHHLRDFVPTRVAT